MKILLLLLIIVFPSIAFAQTAAQQQTSPEMQAIQSKLQEEYQQNLQLRAALIKEQLKVKELEEKSKDKSK